MAGTLPAHAPAQFTEETKAEIEEAQVEESHAVAAAEEGAGDYDKVEEEHQVEVLPERSIHGDDDDDHHAAGLNDKGQEASPDKEDEKSEGKPAQDSPKAADEPEASAPAEASPAMEEAKEEVAAAA